MSTSKSASRCSSVLDQRRRPRLGLDDRELAELDAGAGHRAAPPRRRLRLQADRPQRRRPASRRGPWATSQDQQLLVRGEPDPVAAVRLGDVGDLRQQRARRPGRRSARRRRRALPSHCLWTPMWSTGRSGSSGAGPSISVPLQVLRLQHLAELRPHPSRRPGTSAGPGYAAGGSRSRGRSARRRARPRAPRAAAPTTPSRLASIGLVDRPPPTHRSKPGPWSGWMTPRNEMSLASYGVSGSQRDRRLELARQVGQRRVADELGGDLLDRLGRVEDLVGRDTRDRAAEDHAGVSPQASVVDRPTPSSSCQIAGMSSMRIQCNWMFCRSVMSAVSRPNRSRDARDRAQLGQVELTAVDADAEHEVLVVELVRFEDGGATAVDARRLRWV